MENAWSAGFDSETFNVSSGNATPPTTLSTYSVSNDSDQLNQTKAASSLSLSAETVFACHHPTQKYARKRATSQCDGTLGDHKSTTSSHLTPGDLRPAPKSVYRLLDNDESEGFSTEGGDSAGDSGDEIVPEQRPKENPNEGPNVAITAVVRRPSNSPTWPERHDHRPVTPLQKASGLQKFDCVLIPSLLVPKSRYDGYKHHLPVSDERHAISEILEKQNEHDDDIIKFNEILLEDFVIYRPQTRTYYPWQMITLDSIVSGREGCKYLLDGVLRCGQVRHYLQAAEIDINSISIDGFEHTSVHSVRDMVYLQTTACARRRHKVRRCWYRLGAPSEQYASLHQKFLWIADLAKHVIDYLDWSDEVGTGNGAVQLRDFKSDFVAKLKDCHQESPDIQRWLALYGSTDFRIPINRHREFIFSRAFNLRGHYLKHALWSEIMVRPECSAANKDRGPEDTLVTPYVKHCCKSMPWSYALKAESMSDSVKNDHQYRAEQMNFPYPTTRQLLSDMAEGVSETSRILEEAALSRKLHTFSPEEALGSFCIIRMKRAERGRVVFDYSYAYVQDVVEKRFATELKVIFVYLPSETICLDGYYPRGDELFLSDCCNCFANSEPILLTDIARLVGVTFGDKVGGQQGFFVRQKYLHGEDAICQLREADFRCRCRYPSSQGKLSRHAQDERRTPLPGLGLFAGCGNFDLGLEVGEAVKFVAAVEINETALRSYAANREEGLDGLILDSVNPCLRDVFQGGTLLPGIGNVLFISSGSPCKGFSLVNHLRADDKGMRNCSLLASSLAYIETYLPNYAILENVPSMASGVGNACNQVIACLVGLGYQVRKMIGDPRHFGSPQSRKRLFIVAAAPGLALPAALVRTLQTAVPQARAVSKGLPPMDNDDVICIPYPDHIPGAKQTPMFRELIRRVPRFPKKMSFWQSLKAGYQGEAQMSWYQGRKSLQVENHMAYTRIDPDGSIPTITTGPNPSCSRGGGKIIHWDEHRTLTLQEARRVQGMPDEQVLIGDLPQQWAQVGNAVNRQVAAALGKTIADSWFFNGWSAGPKIVVAIPGQPPSRGKECPTRELPLFLPGPGGSAADGVHWSTKAALLADQSHTGSNDIISEGQDMVDLTAVDSDITDNDSIIAASAESVFKAEMRASHRVDEAGKQKRPTDYSRSAVNVSTEVSTRSANSQAVISVGSKRLYREEVELIRSIFSPQDPASLPAREANRQSSNSSSNKRPATQDLRFNQIQRREMTRIEEGPAGEQVPVHMVSERKLDVHQTRPLAAADIFEQGSQENPIDIDTDVDMEVSMSKRWSNDVEDGEDEDTELKGWVGKRVRSRIDEMGGIL